MPAEGRRQIDGELYVLANNVSLRLAGIRGKHIFIDMARDGSRFTIEGKKRGRIEVPLDTIRCIRARTEDLTRNGRLLRYRCLIWREGARTILLDGTRSWFDYNDFMRHLAREMKRRGRFDRVQRGMRIWEAIFHPLLFALAVGIVGVSAYHIWSTGSPDDARTNGAIAGIFLLFGMFLVYVGVRDWFDRVRPRPVRSMKDLAGVLPLPGQSPRDKI